MPEGFGQTTTTKPKPPQRSQQHDALCITVTAAYGMVYCWCMKPCCWHPEGQRRQKKRGSADPDAKTYREPEEPRYKGRCVCRACPCHDPLYLLPSIGTIQANAGPPPSKRQRTTHTKGR